MLVAGTLLAGQVADRNTEDAMGEDRTLLIMINTVSYIDPFNIGNHRRLRNKPNRQLRRGRVHDQRFFAARRRTDTLSSHCHVRPKCRRAKADAREFNVQR
jgi:hypothetical protein